MQLRESKTDYLVFTRAQSRFVTRFTVDNKFIEGKEVSKLLGVWLQEDGGWQTNTTELCKKTIQSKFLLDQAIQKVPSHFARGCLMSTGA